ncbi:MAG: hydrolase, partial [Glaciecola sp.]
MFTTQFGQKTLAQYSAPPWCRNPHLQTIWPRFFGRRQLVETQLERLETPDGDFLDLAWGPAPEYVEAVIILFHGLEGSKDSHYIQDMLQSAL